MLYIVICLVSFSLGYALSSLLTVNKVAELEHRVYELECEKHSN